MPSINDLHWKHYSWSDKTLDVWQTVLHIFIRHFPGHDKLLESHILVSFFTSEVCNGRASDSSHGPLTRYAKLRVVHALDVWQTVLHIFIRHFPGHDKLWESHILVSFFTSEVCNGRIVPMGLLPDTQNCGLCMRLVTPPPPPPPPPLTIAFYLDPDL